MKETIAVLQALKEKILDTKRVVDVDFLLSKQKQLEAQMSDPKFWNNAEVARRVAQEHDELRTEVETWQRLEREVTDLLELSALAEKENDAATAKDIREKLPRLTDEVRRLELRILFHGEHDARHAILAIHAGVGGVDAQDWAQMLLRMVLRFCDDQGFAVTMLEESRGSEAGVKRVVMEIAGRHAYGLLRSEHGVHRLVRISPFDAEKMRHTSFALIEVVPDLGDVEEIRVRDEDLKIDTFRSSGHGGQSVNTTDSAVRITHLPTGIVVSCQNERSQTQNRASAMKYLKSKLFTYEQAKADDERKKIRGELTSADWGSQIRSYVLHPYQLVKDHRTQLETSDVVGVLDGKLLPFIEAFLKQSAQRFKRGESV